MERVWCCYWQWKETHHKSSFVMRINPLIVCHRFYNLALFFAEIFFLFFFFLLSVIGKMRIQLRDAKEMARLYDIQMILFISHVAWDVRTRGSEELGGKINKENFFFYAAMVNEFIYKNKFLYIFML